MKNIFYNQSSANYRAVATNAAGQRWNGSTWEAHVDGNWATYLITPTQQGTSTQWVYSVPDDAEVIEIFAAAAPAVTATPEAVADDPNTRISIR